MQDTNCHPFSWGRTGRNPFCAEVEIRSKIIISGSFVVHFLREDVVENFTCG
jgi:hypothetical protein